MITIPPPGVPPTSSADIAARRSEFHRLRKLLGLSSAELGKLTGLSENTIRNYGARKPSGTATRSTLEVMRQAAIRQAEVNIVDARNRLAEAESARQELENEAA
jgi:hypothetical protein